VETTRCTIWVYIRKYKLNKERKVPLLMRVTVNGRRWDSALKVRINPNNWDPLKEKAIGDDSFSNLVKLRDGIKSKEMAVIFRVTVK
jgi:Arm DNA-binding domain